MSTTYTVILHPATLATDSDWQPIVFAGSIDEQEACVLDFAQSQYDDIHDGQVLGHSIPRHISTARTLLYRHGFTIHTGRGTYGLG